MPPKPVVPSSLGVTRRHELPTPLQLSTKKLVVAKIGGEQREEWQFVTISMSQASAASLSNIRERSSPIEFAVSTPSQHFYTEK
jgi:hypothetical protein